MENSRDNPPKQSPNRLVQLLEARPLMFWGGMWASLVLVAAVSVSSLVSPGLMGSGQTASGAAIGSSSNSSNTVAQPASPATAHTQNSVPFWLFSAIALSCTAGSILVSKQLAPQRSRRILRTPPPRPVAVQPPQQELVKQKIAKQRRAEQKTVSRKTVSQKTVNRQRSQPQPAALTQNPSLQPPTAQRTRVQPARVQATRVDPTVRQTAASRRSVRSPQPIAQRSSRRAASPQRVPAQARPVAIVPQSEVHPLDWKTASIADSMDLRKQRSLASWL